MASVATRKLELVVLRPSFERVAGQANTSVDIAISTRASCSLLAGTVCRRVPHCVCGY